MTPRWRSGTGNSRKAPDFRRKKQDASLALRIPGRGLILGLTPQMKTGKSSHTFRIAILDEVDKMGDFTMITTAESRTLAYGSDALIASVSTPTEDAPGTSWRLWSGGFARPLALAVSALRGTGPLRLVPGEVRFGRRRVLETRDHAHSVRCMRRRVDRPGAEPRHTAGPVCSTTSRTTPPVVPRSGNRACLDRPGGGPFSRARRRTGR